MRETTVMIPVSRRWYASNRSKMLEHVTTATAKAFERVVTDQVGAVGARQGAKFVPDAPGQLHEGEPQLDGRAAEVGDGEASDFAED